MTQEEKIKALSDALQRTEAILYEFRDVVKHNFTDHVNTLDDFSSLATDIVSSMEPEQESNEDVKPVAPPQEDNRLGMGLEELNKEALLCTRCALASTRNNVVFGEGCADRPKVMVIGEGPGENEDITGRPFVGKAGQYLDSWLAAISLSRETNTYIANTVKCRPPQNRDPQEEELRLCFPFLKQQIRCIKPSAILCLGKPASIQITGKTDATMGELRGRFTFYEGIPVICTYHPSAVLRNPDLKRPVWDDLRKLAIFLGLDIAGSRRS